ncbi:Cupin domain [Aedoeadaptatus ivorii]|uniref:Cupin domain n=1 Tax=Aedoeadaptatus ivorii TaxID=54006 RepID=A0A3S4YUH9_9FIRM|nr:cupin domain-containing protein [Peptoniphilus ivorii]VEJ34515.1 Cupin domain [Peptoniphilus ivorii]
MHEIMKNIEKATALSLKEQVSYQEGQVVSKTIAQNDGISLTLFSFDAGEEISTHVSDGDALVLCLDGTGEIAIDGEASVVEEGDAILMPAGHPHAVRAKARFKMLLIVVKPSDQ